MKLFTTLLRTACLCAAANAGAAEWSAAPAVSWTVDHDSNRVLSASEQPSQGGIVQLDLLLKRATGTSNLWMRPHVGWKQYTDSVARNSNDQSLQAGGTWINDRSVFNAQASMARDNSLNTELADTGIFTGSSLRRSKTAGLSWSHEQSDRSDLGVQLSYSEIEYEDVRFFSFFGLQFPLTSLRGYQYPSVSVTSSHQWSPRSSFELGASASRLISQGDTDDSDSFDAHVGFNRALTSHIKLHFTAGLSRQTIAERHESGYIGRFELTHVGVLGQWRLYAARNVSPSGYGSLVTRDDAGLSFDRRLTPRWTGTLSLRVIENDDLVSSVSGEHQRYERAEAGAAWQATRTVRLNAAASLSRVQRAGVSQSAEAWRVALAATWMPQPRMLSR